MTLAAGTLTVVEECRIVDGVLVLVVTEPRLDAASAPSVRSRLGAELERNPGRVLVDLSRVTFMDSTGLGALVQLLKQASSRGPVAMAGVRGPVAVLMRLTHLDKAFAAHPNVEGALRALGLTQEPAWPRHASAS